MVQKGTKQQLGNVLEFNKRVAQVHPGITALEVDWYLKSSKVWRYVHTLWKYGVFIPVAGITVM